MNSLSLLNHLSVFPNINNCRKTFWQLIKFRLLSLHSLQFDYNLITTWSDFDKPEYSFHVYCRQILTCLRDTHSKMILSRRCSLGNLAINIIASSHMHEPTTILSDESSQTRYPIIKKPRTFCPRTLCLSRPAGQRNVTYVEFSHRKNSHSRTHGRHRISLSRSR